MTLCDRCHEQVGYGAEEIGDEIYCGSCAATIHEREAEDEEVMATWREADAQTNRDLTQALIDSFNLVARHKARAYVKAQNAELDRMEAMPGDGFDGDVA